MHVGMVVYGGGPGVQHREDSGRGAHIAFVATQRDDRLGRGLHEQAVAVGLIGAQCIAQLRGRRYGDVIIRTREQLDRARVEPLLGLMGMAGRAGAVATSVVDMEVLAATLTAVDMPAHRRSLSNPDKLCRAAGQDIVDGAAVRRQEPVAERIEIRRRELAQYIRDFDGRHNVGPASIEQRNGKAADHVIDLTAYRLGQVQIRLRRLDARVAQQDPDRLGRHNPAPSAASRNCAANCGA